MPVSRPLLALAVSALLLGCAGDDPTSGSTDGPTPPPPTADPSVPATPSPSGGDGEGAASAVPADLFGTVLEQAAARSGVEPSAIEVVRAEAVTWRDGSLGCPQDGQGAIQSLVEGYWIVLDADGTALDFRTAGTETVLLCEDGGEPPLEQ